MTRIKWRSQAKRDLLVSRLASHVRTGSGSGISCNAVSGVRFDLRLDITLPVVQEWLDWPETLSSEERHSILFQALATTVKNNNLSSSTLVTECGGLLSKRMRQRKRRYRVFGSISLDPGMAPTRRKLASGSVRFGTRLAGDRTQMATLLLEIEQRGLKDFPTTMAVDIDARNSDVAYSVAHWELDVRRALWNLYLNRKTRRVFTSPMRPVNQIVWGPVTTVHYPDGRPTDSGLWMNRDAGDVRILRPENADAFKYEAKTFRLIQRSPIREFIYKALVGYVRALDITDQQQCFTSLWTVLEHLTGGLATKNTYDQLIRRALACSDVPREERSYLQEEMQYLRNLRNELVHRGRSQADEHAAVQALLHNVHRVLAVFLGILRRSNSIDDAFAALDLPSNRVALRKHKAAVDHFSRLRKH